MQYTWCMLVPLCPLTPKKKLKDLTFWAVAYITLSIYVSSWTTCLVIRPSPRVWCKLGDPYQRLSPRPKNTYTMTPTIQLIQRRHREGSWVRACIASSAVVAAIYFQKEFIEGNKPIPFFNLLGICIFSLWIYLRSALFAAWTPKCLMSEFWFEGLIQVGWDRMPTINSTGALSKSYALI